MGAPDLDLALSGYHPNFARLFNLMTGIDVPDAAPALTRPATIEATIDGALDGFDLTATLGLAGGTVTADGRIEDLTSELVYAVATQISHPDAAAFFEELGSADVFADLEGPLSIGGRLRGNTDAMVIPNLSANFAGTSVVGSIDIGFDKARPDLTADLVTGPVVVDRLLPMLAIAAGEALNLENGSAAAAEGERWSKEPIDLAALDTFDAAIVLSAESLRFADYTFVRAEVSLSLANGTLTLDRLAGRLFDGDAVLTGQLVTTPAPRARLTIEVDGADVEQALERIAGIDIITGRADFEGRFDTQGRSARQLILGLQGRGTIRDSDGGAIRGFDLLTFSDALADLDRIEGLADAVAAGFAGGRPATPISAAISR